MKFGALTLERLSEIITPDILSEEDVTALSGELTALGEKIATLRYAREQATPKTDTVAKEHTFRVLRVSAKQRKVMSVVYAPDTPDSWGDYMEAAEIEKAADFFMANHQNIDEMHDMIAGVGYVTQSFIARANDPYGFQEGAWVIEVKVMNDSVWKKIASGEYKAFSFSASARGGKTKELESVWVDDSGNPTSPYPKDEE